MEAVFPDDIKGSGCFPDVGSEWFASYICAAKTKGVLKGYPDGTFRPGQFVSFAEASKIIMKAFGEEVEQDDVWYRPYIERLGQKKAIPGSITTFDKNITRGEMAEIIYRLHARIMTKATQTYSSIASWGGSGGEKKVSSDEYADWQTYKNRLHNILIKYPPGWHIDTDGKIVKIQNIEGSFTKMNAPEGIKWFWIDTEFKPGIVKENELISNTLQYTGVKREVLTNATSMINFYNFTDKDCGVSARAFWSTDDTEFYAYHARKCGQSISKEDKELFRKMIQSFEDF